MSYTHEKTTVISEAHLDSFGHVNNARYFELLEQARWDLITERGFGIDTIRSTRSTTSYFSNLALGLQSCAWKKKVRNGDAFVAADRQQARFSTAGAVQTSQGRRTPRFPLRFSRSNC